MFFSVKNVTSTLIALVENDHLDDWNPEEGLLLATNVSTTCPTTLSSESSDSFSQLKIEVEKL